MDKKYDLKHDFMIVGLILFFAIYLFLQGFLIVEMCLGKVDCVMIGKIMSCHQTESGKK